MSKHNLRELRSHIQSALAEAGRDGISTPDIIAKLRKQYPKVVERVSRQLEDRALTKLIADVASRRPRKTGDNQQELFPDCPGLHQGTQFVAGRWKRTEDATIQEAKDWLASGIVKSSSRRDKVPAFAKLVRELEAAGAKPNMTLGEAYKKFKKP